MLHPGDKVVVVQGDLLHLTGRVVAVTGATFTMEPIVEPDMGVELPSRLEMPVEEVMKSFDTGDRVKVLAGTFMGETGIVVKVKDTDACTFLLVAAAWCLLFIFTPHSHTHHPTHPSSQRARTWGLAAWRWCCWMQG